MQAIYISPLNTFMRKGKDPDPDPAVSLTNGSGSGRQAQKHADPADPVPDPDPQHCFPFNHSLSVAEDGGSVLYMGSEG